jgi:hypothetical protein
MIFQDLQKMDDGWAIVGIPAEGTVLKYDLFHDVATAMDTTKQTLNGTSITSSGDGLVVMEFVTLMEEDGEVPILVGENPVLFSYGGAEFGMHTHDAHPTITLETRSTEAVATDDIDATDDVVATENETVAPTSVAVEDDETEEKEEEEKVEDETPAPTVAKEEEEEEEETSAPTSAAVETLAPTYTATSSMTMSMSMSMSMSVTTDAPAPEPEDVPAEDLSIDAPAPEDVPAEDLSIDAPAEDVSDTSSSENPPPTASDGTTAWLLPIHVMSLSSGMIWFVVAMFS